MHNKIVMDFLLLLSFIVYRHPKSMHISEKNVVFEMKTQERGGSIGSKSNVHPPRNCPLLTKDYIKAMVVSKLSFSMATFPQAKHRKLLIPEIYHRWCDSRPRPKNLENSFSFEGSSFCAFCFACLSFLRMFLAEDCNCVRVYEVLSCAAN